MPRERLSHEDQDPRVNHAVIESIKQSTLLRLTQLLCCGWKELDGLIRLHRPNITPEECLRSVVAQMYQRIFSAPDGTYFKESTFRPLKPNCGSILFTQASSLAAGAPPIVTYGEQFRDFLLAGNFGHVIPLESVINPNTGRRVDSWQWIVNWDTLEDFALQQFKKETTDDGKL